MTREERKEYNRQYYETHKDKILEQVKKYATKHREKRLAYNKEYHKQHYLENRDEILEYHRNLYHSRLDYERERKREYRLEHLEEEKQYRAKNAEKYRQYSSKSVKNHPEKNVIRRNRRKSNVKSLPATLTVEQWEYCKNYFDNKCCYCGKEAKLTQEHFIPVTHGGAYSEENIIPACRSCNSSKVNKFFDEWYKNKEFYSLERERKILQYINDRICQRKIG